MMKYNFNKKDRFKISTNDTKNRYMLPEYPLKDTTHSNSTSRNETFPGYRLLKGTSLNPHMIIRIATLTKPCFLIWNLAKSLEAPS